jgi:hypothetical protein
VSTYQFFEDLQSRLIFPRLDHWCWLVPMLRFYKMVPYPFDEKILSSRLFAGIYFVRIGAASSISIILTTLDTGSIRASTVLYKSTLHLFISRLLG